jgi:hypothetical protein
MTIIPARQRRGTSNQATWDAYNMHHGTIKEQKIYKTALFHLIVPIRQRSV